MSGVRRAERKEREMEDGERKAREQEAFESIIEAGASETFPMIFVYALLTGRDVESVTEDVQQSRQARHERAMQAAYGERN
jgi:hypothetical protein